MHQYFIDLVSKEVSLSERDVALCKTCFEPALFPKNTIVEEEQQVPRYLYFVVSGFMRLFHYNAAGEEVTTHINCPPGFITSYFNFTSETRSNENVACITNCEVLKISKPNLDRMIEESPAFKDFSLQVFQRSLIYNETRANELATLTAEARYKKLLQNYPSIVQHVPIQYIASFLGMKPESLSRIRRTMH